MAITKTSTNIVAPATSVAAAGTNTSSATNVTTGYDIAVGLKITNGGTGPTVQSVGSLYGSSDGTNWYLIGQVPGGTTASAVSSVWFAVPAGTSYVQTVFTGNTGQAVTVGAQLAMMTAL
jgi:hypothetical protein